MSKAKEKALKAYPIKIAERDGYDENLRERNGFVKGYQQAEKDLELTWKDIVHIIETYDELEFSREFATVTFNDTCKEVLKRFKSYGKKEI
jgi:hypothetical protein